MGPVGRVTMMLEGAGFVSLRQPQAIAGIPFEFAAMLVGGTSLDLVVVLDLAIDAEEERIRRRVEGLARALDLVGSRRSLTLVLVGPRPPRNLIHTLAEVARVLTVGSPGEGEDSLLCDALAVLLPLDLATEEEGPGAVGSSGWEEASERLGRRHPQEMTPVLAVTGRGKKAVREALRAVLCAPLEDDDDEEGRSTG